MDSPPRIKVIWLKLPESEQIDKIMLKTERNIRGYSKNIKASTSAKFEQNGATPFVKGSSDMRQTPTLDELFSKIEVSFFSIQCLKKDLWRQQIICLNKDEELLDLLNFNNFDKSKNNSKIYELITDQRKYFTLNTEGGKTALIMSMEKSVAEDVFDLIISAGKKLESIGNLNQVEREMKEFLKKVRKSATNKLSLSE